MLPSIPAAMPNGELPNVGVANSVTVPFGVMRPIFPGNTFSVNHTLPSKPATMPCGDDPAAGNSLIVPFGVQRPMALLFPSVNQRFPSAPAVMLAGKLSDVGMVNSVIVPAGVMRPTLLALDS